MLQLADAELDMLATLLPDHPVNPKGGRPPTNQRKAIGGIFWILDNGAKWKDLPTQFGSKTCAFSGENYVSMPVYDGNTVETTFQCQFTMEMCIIAVETTFQCQFAMEMQ